ncbi:MAG: hypothetical protein ACFNPU_05730 [Corynebacterium matruchotii]
MTVPKPILVTALTIPAATPDRQAVPGKPEAPANQGCRQNRCKNSGRRTQMRLSLSVWPPPRQKAGKLADSNAHSTSKTVMCGSICGRKTATTTPW